MLKLTTFLFVLLVAVPVWFGAVAAAETTIGPQLQAALQTAIPGDEVKIIITLKEKFDLKRFKALHGKKKKKLRRALLVKALRQNSDLAQKDLRKLLRQAGVKRIRPIWVINSVAATIPVEFVETLAALPNVGSLRLDGTLSLPGGDATASAPAEWNLDAIQATSLWNAGFTGQGAVLASIGTGVDIAHPDLAGRYRGGTNSWYDPNGEHAIPYDAAGHGTQTVGVMVGGDAGGSSIGVAPGARWIAAKVYNDAGIAEYSAIHLAFQWLLDPDNDPDTDDAPDAVNGSWGFDQYLGQCFSEFQADIQILRAADIAVVFSAGNSGPSFGTSISPANYPESTSVGAVDMSLAPAGFSSAGPSACDGGIYPEIVAPGVFVKTTDLTFDGIFTDSYIYVSGTSYAAPHLAGSLALLKSAFPDKPMDELESGIRQSALDLGVSGPDNDSGYGLVDVFAAYDLLLSGTGCVDADGDGYFFGANCGTAPDCNDHDAGINPGAGEICGDGIDQDCSGIDLICQDNPNDIDDDADGYTENQGDCNDNDPLTYPGADEIPHDGIDQNCNGFDSLYFSTLGRFAVPGVNGKDDDADIYSWDGNSFAKLFDAGNAGLPGNADIDALQVIDADTIYMSFSRNQGTSVPGIGLVEDEDIVIYSAGSWSLFFDGSDVGLADSNAEDVDAFTILSDGSLVVSTVGNPSPLPTANGALRDEDLLRCVGGSYGENTSCTVWELYLDGSDIGLNDAATEEINGIGLTADGDILFTTLADYSTGGLSGGGTDVSVCRAPVTGQTSSCRSIELFFDGDANGLPGGTTAARLDALDLK